MCYLNLCYRGTVTPINAPAMISNKLLGKYINLETVFWLIFILSQEKNKFYKLTWIGVKYSTFYLYGICLKTYFSNIVHIISNRFLKTQYHKPINICFYIYEYNILNCVCPLSYNTVYKILW